MAEAKKMMNIYEAISKCMEDIGAVGKNDKNKTQGFMYRGIDAVMNAINPALVKNHVFVVPEVLEQQAIMFSLAQRIGRSQRSLG